MAQIPTLVLKLIPLENEVKACTGAEEIPFKQAMKISQLLIQAIKNFSDTILSIYEKYWSLFSPSSG